MRLLWLSSLRGRLVVLVLLAVLPALAVIFHSAREQRRAMSLEAQASALRIARLVATSQNNLVEGARQFLLALTQIPEIRKIDPEACPTLARRLLARDPRYTNIGVADAEGNVRCSGIAVRRPVNIADRAYFRGALKSGGFAIGEYQIGRVTSRAAVNFGYAIVAPDGSRQGVVYAGLGLAWLNRLAEQVELPEGATLTIVDPNATILARYPDSEKWIGQPLPPGPLRDLLLASTGEGTAEAPGADRIPRLHGYARVGGKNPGATVIVSTRKDLAFSAANSILAVSLGWMILVSVLALAGAWWGGEWLIVRWVDRLIAATQRVTGGDLTVRVGRHRGGGELEQLAAAFDRMAEALEQRAAEAERAKGQIQDQLRRILALREINSAANATLDLDMVLNVLMGEIDALLPYTAMLVWLRNSEGKLERAGCWNLDADDWKGRNLSATPRLVEEAIETREPVIVRNIQEDPRVLDPDFYRRHGLVSYLGVPLIGKNKVVGVLVFLTREEYRFSPEEIDFLVALAGQAAVAINNSQLYEETKKQAAALEKANEDLRRKEQIQALLKEVNQDVTRLDIEALFSKLTGKICEFFKADVADVRILKDDCWSVLGVSGVEPQLIPTVRHGSSNRRSRWIVEHRKPLVIRDASTTALRPRRGTLRRLGLRGYVGVPLISRNGDVAGVLRALTYEPREFTTEEIELLQTIANGAAVALENAMLVEQIKLQAVALEKANRVKSEFLGFVSHELKTPVNLIKGYTELVEMIGGLAPEQEHAVRKLEKCSDELIGMINTLLEATKIEAGAIQVQAAAVDLRAFFEDLQSSYQVPLDKDLTLQWRCAGTLPVVRIDGEKLKHIAQNLLNNAIKYTERGHVTATAAYRPESSELVFRVEDTGIGIPADELGTIFERFRQVGTAAKRASGGVGLGLHIVKTFVELLGGTVTAESEPGKGSVFTVTLPARPEPFGDAAEPDGLRPA
ncbi:MAG TPA: GAF domain-containing protein [candidate division Zixibacteria bacterium]|nr:GAF domain-containing protein [candidate division Zixibacteria bacterium]